MLKSTATTLALLALAAAPIAAPSVAYAELKPKVEPTQPPAETMLSGLVVTAPQSVTRTRYGVTSGIVDMSVKVSYADLDMTTSAGVAELNARVHTAAGYVCHQLERMYPEGAPEPSNCETDAVLKARPQVRRASGPG